ncbi:uncharacterized protein An15g02780 [Aspergillus niger]|uniref:Contig An15c0120, genomic contig n=2 Tax=Aspergillus niger TaxID=5061 RepID=A2R558_ASPNC|nr:uncharacterized protein An15g02780 [Aspergillus niger]CAK42353.1 unnamed protein product [Aspergillus niger]
MGYWVDCPEGTDGERRERKRETASCLDLTVQNRRQQERAHTAGNHSTVDAGGAGWISFSFSRPRKEKEGLRALGARPLQSADPGCHRFPAYMCRAVILSILLLITKVWRRHRHHHPGAGRLAAPLPSLGYDRDSVPVFVAVDS